MEVAGFAPGAPASRRLGIYLQAAAAAAGGAGPRRTFSLASPRAGYLAFATAPSRSSVYATNHGPRSRRELAVMAAAAVGCAGSAAAAGLGFGSRKSMAAAEAGAPPSAAATRGFRGSSVAAGGVRSRFVGGFHNLQAAARGDGVHRSRSMSAAVTSLRGGHLTAPPTSCAAAYQEDCMRRHLSTGLGGPHGRQGRRFFGAPGVLGSSRATMALHSQLGDQGSSTDNKGKPEKKTASNLDELLEAHPRAVAFVKLAAVGLCLLICYSSGKGEMKLLVEAAKDAAELYSFLAHVLILLKQLIFPGSKR